MSKIAQCIGRVYTGLSTLYCIPRDLSLIPKRGPIYNPKVMIASEILKPRHF